MDRLFLSKETKMPYSMTGFGRAEKIFATRKYSVELKSVNSRYCDLNIRMPRLFNFADAAMPRQRNWRPENPRPLRSTKVSLRHIPMQRRRLLTSREDRTISELQGSLHIPTCFR